MGGIFIGFRRGDTSPYAGRLSDTLVNRFRPDSIFGDIDAIAPRERFRRSRAGGFDPVTPCCP